MEKLTNKEISAMYIRALDTAEALLVCPSDDVRPIRRGVATVLGDLAILDESGCEEADQTSYSLTRSLCQSIIDRFSILVYTQYKANLPV